MHPHRCAQRVQDRVKLGTPGRRGSSTLVRPLVGQTQVPVGCRCAEVNRSAGSPNAGSSESEANHRYGIRNIPGPRPILKRYRSPRWIASENVGHRINASVRAVTRWTPCSETSSVRISNCDPTLFQILPGVRGTMTQKISSTTTPRLSNTFQATLPPGSVPRTTTPTPRLGGLSPPAHGYGVGSPLVQGILEIDLFGARHGCTHGSVTDFRHSSIVSVLSSRRRARTLLPATHRLASVSVPAGLGSAHEAERNCQRAEHVSPPNRMGRTGKVRSQPVSRQGNSAPPVTVPSGQALSDPSTLGRSRRSGAPIRAS